MPDYARLPGNSRSLAVAVPFIRLLSDGERLGFSLSPCSRCAPLTAFLGGLRLGVGFGFGRAMLLHGLRRQPARVGLDTQKRVPT